jgi:hypothetical protein
VEVWRLSGRAQYFVRFSKHDTLVFDIKRLTRDQYQRLITARPEYEGIAQWGQKADATSVAELVES